MSGIMIMMASNVSKPVVSGGGGGGSANNRYWVGGTGTWNSSDTTHWSTTSGGSGGASVPTYLNNVFFDANSVSDTGDGIIINSASPNYVNCADLDFTGFIGRLAFYNNGSTNVINVGGNLKLGATANTESALSSSAGFLNLTCNTSPITIYTNNTIWNIPIEIKAGASMISNPVVNLNGDLFLSTIPDNNYSSSPYGYLRLDGGAKQLTFNTNNYNIESNRLTLDSNTTFNLGSSFLTHQWISFTTEYFSNTKINAGTSTINLWSKAGFKKGSENINQYDSFEYVKLNAGNQKLYDVNINGSTNPYQYENVSESNTIHNLTNSVYNVNIGLTYFGNTIFTGAFDIKGIANNLPLVGSIQTAYISRLYQPSGNVSVDYIKLKNTDVGGGASWYAGANSVNIANNSGWAFTNGPIVGSSRTNVYATGGTIIDLPLYRVHVFNASSTFATTSIWPSNLNIEYLVVAGGGGGSQAGGGAGGVLNVKYRTVFSPSTNYTITVGAGGSGASDSLGTLATNGSNSSIIGGSTSIIAIGGGYGATGARNGGNGGSGGGGGTDATSTGYSGGLGVPGQGANGTDGTYSSGKFPIPTVYSWGAGGYALNYYKGDKTSMLGTDLYTGGGGGYLYNNDGTDTYYAGGRLFGGGSNAYGPNGLPNTGGGGGPQATSPKYGNGGSGIVIIRYRYPG